ncbi:MAG: hypothetical protein Q3996_00890 [Candidatus Saccharibacteria bacterium]|nr:hypothetical protein [Candidatus Saccharibacteria bacterium]
MIYGIILIMIILIVNAAKRNVGAALLITLAMTTIYQLIGQDIVNFLAGAGLARVNLLQIVNLILVVLPMLIVLFRSQKCSRHLPTLVFDSGLLFALLVTASGAVIASLIKLDATSLQIQVWIVENYKTIVVLAGLYGFYQVILKPEIE